MEIKRRPRVVYLCLQPMRPGQASYAHVHGIIGGLRALDWDVGLVASNRTSPAGLFRRLVRGTLVQLNLAAILLFRRPQILYVRWHPLSLIGVAAARLLRVPVALEVNGPAEDFTVAWPQLRPLRGLIECSLWWQVRRSLVTFTVTDGLRRWIAAASETPVVVVPNAADPTEFVPAPENSGTRIERYVLFFGAFSPWQGILTLLEAASMPDWPPHLQLWVAGDGMLRKEVEEGIRQNPARMRYLGPLPRAELPTIVSQCEMVAIPKKYERSDVGLSPIKLYESMASGVPVIVSDIQGLGDVVRRHACGLVLSQDPSAIEICAAVRRLSNDDALRRELGDRARLAAEREHTWQKRAATTAQAIDEALASDDGTRRKHHRSGASCR